MRTVIYLYPACMCIKHIKILSLAECFSFLQGILCYIPYRTKVWREKSLANLANFTKSPNFIRQTSYNSTTIVSILKFPPNFIRQIDLFYIFTKLFSRQTFVLYGSCNHKISCLMVVHHVSNSSNHSECGKVFNSI